MQLALVVSLAQDWTEAAHHGTNQHVATSAREEQSSPTTAPDLAAKSGAGYSTKCRTDDLAKKVAHADI